MANKMGIAGRLAAWGERSQITPLLALFGLLLGLMAAMITPREEEPQIDVTMADVMVAFPGARAEQVEQQLATPLEQKIIELCKHLNKHVVVEGIEDEVQLQIFEQLGVERVQGFLFARPMPLEQLLKLLVK